MNMRGRLLVIIALIEVAFAPAYAGGYECKNRKDCEIYSKDTCSAPCANNVLSCGALMWPNPNEYDYDEFFDETDTFIVIHTGVEYRNLCFYMRWCFAVEPGCGGLDYTCFNDEKFEATPIYNYFDWIANDC